MSHNPLELQDNNPLNAGCRIFTVEIGEERRRRSSTVLIETRDFDAF
jgi:hypothetical protein